jgi:hypothetical protein
MADYRAYTVEVDGHFIGVEPLICHNDAEAIEIAKRLIVGHDIELWSGPRLVVRLTVRNRPGAVTHEVKSGSLVPKK